LPVNALTLALFMLIACSMSLYGHMAVELWPRWLARTGAWRVLNPVTHHHTHHRFASGNFGLYFRFWDWICGTEHEAYQGILARSTSVPLESVSGSEGLVAEI
jgi:lathosterol oxidase